MATTTIGTGVIILLVLWIISILSFILLCSAQGKVKFLSILPTIISAIVTIILVFIPRGSENLNPGPAYNYSYTPLIWILILTVLFLMLAASGFIYLVTDIIEPRYARVDKTFGLRR